MSREPSGGGGAFGADSTDKSRFDNAMASDGSDGLSDAEIADVLARARTIAVVGISANPMRPSHEVAAFLQRRGAVIRPVNPGLAGQTLLGNPVAATLADVGGNVDMVDIFRNSEAAGDVVRQAIDARDRLGIAVIWMQLGVINPAAAEQARRAGLTVVMNRCPKIEVARLGL
ncbi:MAG: CoA-binding protein [Hyphomicrobium sp.]